MNCLEFRRAVGAEPAVETADVVAHRLACTACAAWQQKMRDLDVQIVRALAVDLPAASASRAATAAGGGTTGTRGRSWWALAASMLLGIAIGTGLWVSYPRESLAAEVVAHIKHEPAAMTATVPVPAAEVDEVLRAFGLRLKPDAGPVSYSMRCFWRQHWVPHLVLRTASGPVTVFVLPHRPVTAEERFETDGYSGIVLPAPRGSIAVIGRNVPGLAAVAQQVYASIDWGVPAG